MSKIRVLAVDDMPENLQVFGGILVKNGYEIAMANNGKQAIELAKKFKPDVILLDVMMPEMDGYQACTILKSESETKHIPVIFLTAKTEVESTIKAFEVGAIDYIFKPFNSKELLSRVNVHAALKIANEKLWSQKKELERTNDIKTKLFSIIGHDLKAPLNAIYSLMDLIEMNVLDDVSLKQNIEILKSNVGNTSELLNNLLNWTASQINKNKIEYKEININKLLESEVVNQTYFSFQKNINLFFNSSSVSVFLSDEQSIKLIFRNLIKNAIKFTPQNGSIEIGCVEENKVLKFYVKDSGIGISTEAIAKILDNGFHTTNGTNGEKGTGLGLLLCREYIEKLGGSFKIESKVGEGTTMGFYFPQK